MPLYVKGEGGANVVLAWREGKGRASEEQEDKPRGSDSGNEQALEQKKRRRREESEDDDEDSILRRALQGRVLRVRKARRRAAAAAAAAVSVGGGDGCGDGPEAEAEVEAALDAAIWAPLAGAWCSRAERDEAFAHRVLAPALGPLLQRGRPLLQAATGSAGGEEDGDHHDDAALWRAAAAALGRQRGEVKGLPATIDPHVPPELLPDATRPLTAEELREVAALAAGRRGRRPPRLLPVGPPVCFEVKPKAGVRPPADAGGDSREASIRARFPRFALHGLLKAAAAAAGAAEGAGAGAVATAASPPLLAPPLYDPWRLFDAAKEAAAAAASSSAQGPSAAAAREVAALLERPSNNLRFFLNGEPLLGVDLEALRGAFLDPGTDLEAAAAAAAAADAEGPRPPPSPPPPRTLVAALVAGALLSSGALPALAKLQATDDLGPEAAAALHGALLAKVQAEEGRRQQQHDGGEMPPCRLPADDLARMRAYGTVVTAKDASVMLTLQQVAVAADEDEEREEDEEEDDGGRGGDGAAGRNGAIDGTPTPPSDPQPRGLGLLPDPRDARAWATVAAADERRGAAPAGRRWLSAFAWRARVVDVDLKPSAKARAHAELERRCLEHACAVVEVEDEDGEAGAAAATTPPRLRRYLRERAAWEAWWDAEWRVWQDQQQQQLIEAAS